LEAQPALVEYFVSLMRVRSSIAAEYNLLTRRLERGALFKDVGCAYSMHKLLCNYRAAPHLPDDRPDSLR
jgi:hypothetical protein